MELIRRKKYFILAGIVSFFFLGDMTFIQAQEGYGRGRITGTVVDDKGSKVEGVIVVLKNDRGVQLEGSTDKDGFFAIIGLGTGVWNLAANKKGYAPFSSQITVRQLRQNPSLDITLKKLTGTTALLADDRAMELFKQAELLMKEEKYDDALNILTELQIKHPDIYQINQNIGTCYMNKGQLDKAETEYNLVLDKIKEQFGSHVADKAAALGALTGLGSVYLKKKDYQTAQDYFTQALAISPKDATSAFNVGGILFSVQQIDEAIKYYKLAAEIDKEWPDPHLKLGYVYLNKTDYDKSLEHFNKFIQMAPDNPAVPEVNKLIDTIKNLKK